MTYICPRPECGRTSEAAVYCRHGLAADLAPGNWMVPEDDRTVMARGSREAIARAREVEEAKAALLQYAAASSQWVRAFELRTVGGAGKSMRAVNLAYAQLVASGELEAGDFVRIRQEKSRLQPGGGR